MDTMLCTITTITQVHKVKQMLDLFGSMLDPWRGPEPPNAASSPAWLEVCRPTPLLVTSFYSVLLCCTSFSSPKL